MKNYEKTIYRKLLGWRVMTSSRKFKISLVKDLSLVISLMIATVVIGGYSEVLVNSIEEQSPSISYTAVRHLPTNENIKLSEEEKEGLSPEELYKFSLKTNPQEWTQYFDRIDVCSYNNPGNLVYAGQPYASKVGRWASFPDVKTGFRALIKQIELDMSRDHTIKTFIGKYAPNHENTTNQYISQICEWIDVEEDTKIKDIDAVVLAKAIVRKECNY